MQAFKILPIAVMQLEGLFMDERAIHQLMEGPLLSCSGKM